MGISLDSLRDLAGRAVWAAASTSINPFDTVTLASEDFNRLAILLASPDDTLTMIGLGHTPTSTSGIRVGSGSGVVEITHGHYGPGAGQAVIAHNPGAGFSAITLYTLTLIK